MIESKQSAIQVINRGQGTLVGSRLTPSAGLHARVLFTRHIRLPVKL